MSVSLPSGSGRVAQARAALDAILSEFHDPEYWRAQARAGNWSVFEAPTDTLVGIFDPSLSSRKAEVIAARDALRAAEIQAATEAADAPPDVNPLESTAAGQAPRTWIPEVTIVGQSPKGGGSDMPTTLIAIVAMAGLLYLLNRGSQS